MKKGILINFIFVILLLVSSCNKKSVSNISLLDNSGFDTIINGKQGMLFTLRNDNGCVAQFTNLGGRWVSMWVPDKSGKMTDVVLGFNSLEAYLAAGEPYHGAIVGRVCGRINDASFNLDGLTYQLAHNDGFGKPEKNHLHGGIEGFHRKVWDGTTFENETGEQGIRFTYTSVNSEEGYPGNLDVSVSYLLTNDNALRIEFRAVTDQLTIVNLTNHVFFNLNGEGNGDILSHKMKIQADKYIECDGELIPTGYLKPVSSTPLDYREIGDMGKGIYEDHDQVFKNMGYAAAMVINAYDEDSIRPVAEAYSSTSGIKMSVTSNQPSLQIYNAWLFDGKDVGKSGKNYVFSGGFVMETQGFPDAPNHENFPDIRLYPGETYYHECEYKFSIQN